MMNAGGVCPSNQEDHRNDGIVAAIDYELQRERGSEREASVIFELHFNIISMQV